MFNNRSSESETLDNLSLDNHELQKNLDEMNFINRWFGTKSALLDALNCVWKNYARYFENHTIVIGDLGCGGGDMLRTIDQWAISHKVDVELIGIDANPSIIRYAHENSKYYPNIKYKTMDILSPDLAHYQFDIICMNNICHHFNDVTLIQILRKLKTQARIAIIINDLHRYWLSYFAIKCLSILFNFTSLAKKDGPLSVLRAFRKKEIISLLDEAGLRYYQICWAWAFRWKIILWCEHEN